MLMSTTFFPANTNHPVLRNTRPERPMSQCFPIMSTFKGSKTSGKGQLVNRCIVATLCVDTDLRRWIHFEAKLSPLSVLRRICRNVSEYELISEIFRDPGGDVLQLS